MHRSYYSWFLCKRRFQRLKTLIFHLCSSYGSKWSPLGLIRRRCRLCATFRVVVAEICTFVRRSCSCSSCHCSKVSHGTREWTWLPRARPCHCHHFRRRCRASTVHSNLSDWACRTVAASLRSPFRRERSTPPSATSWTCLGALSRLCQTSCLFLII